MNINGKISVIGNLVLADDGTAEILNACLERLTDMEEDAVGLTLTPVHQGRLIFNISSNSLKVWDGYAFSTVGGEADLTPVQLQSLMVALGPFIKSSGTFDVTAFSSFANISWASAASLLDILQAVDVRLGQLDMPKALSTVADVRITTPLPGNVLKYNNAQNTWVNGIVQVTDLANVVVSSLELNHLVGTTDNIRTRFSTIQNSVGLPTTGILPVFAGTSYLNGVTTVVAAVLRLDQQLKALELSTAIEKTATRYTTTFTNKLTINVVHLLDDQYPTVICVDSTNKTIDGVIQYIDQDNLSITFPTISTGTVIVTGALRL